MKNGGTGGANTNKSGLAFERKTNLADRIKEDLADKYTLKEIHFPNKSTAKAFEVIRKSNNTKIGILTQQMRFYDVMKQIYDIDNVNHKRWKPDEAFFNMENNTVYIVEKKWQNTSGSVDEKIFGFVNKRRLYQNNFNQLTNEPKPTVEFCALFNSSWWLDGNNGKNMQGYQDYFDNLRIDGVKIFFDSYEYWWFGL